MSDKGSNGSKKVTLVQAANELSMYVEDIYKGIKSGKLPIGEVIQDDKLGIRKYYIYRERLDAYKNRHDIKKSNTKRRWK